MWAWRLSGIYSLSTNYWHPLTDHMREHQQQKDFNLVPFKEFPEISRQYLVQCTVQLRMHSISAPISCLPSFRSTTSWYIWPRDRRFQGNQWSATMCSLPLIFFKVYLLVDLFHHITYGLLIFFKNKNRSPLHLTSKNERLQYIPSII